MKQSVLSDWLTVAPPLKQPVQSDWLPVAPPLKQSVQSDWLPVAPPPTQTDHRLLYQSQAVRYLPPAAHQWSMKPYLVSAGVAAVAG